MERELLEEFIEWARDCGEDAFYIFENEINVISARNGYTLTK